MDAGQCSFTVRSKAITRKMPICRPGKYIPMVFFAWDGHNGDAGRKMAVSAFYYLVMEPPIPKEAYIYPILVAIGMVGIEGWVLTRRKNKRARQVVIESNQAAPRGWPNR